jgi:hypothetical protein
LYPRFFNKKKQQSEVLFSAINRFWIYRFAHISFNNSETKLFKNGRPEQIFVFVKTETFEASLVQVHYNRKRDKIDHW